MAFTERYVRSDADGTGNGTTDANSGANGSFTWAQMLADTTANPCRYNIKAGTYARTTSTDTFTTAGVIANPRYFRGFNGTLGDLVNVGRTVGGALITTNFPLITTTTGNITFPAFSTLENLSFSKSNQNGGAAVTGITALIRRCKFNNDTTLGSSVCGLSGGGMVMDCDCSVPNASNVAAAALKTNVNSMIRGGLFTASTAGAAGINVGNVADISGAMIRDCTGGVVATATIDRFSGCSFRNISGICFDNQTTNWLHIVDCTAWGAAGTSKFYNSTTSVRAVRLGTNAVGNFGAADVNLGDYTDENRLTLTADPFLSSTDLRLNQTAGGGAVALRASDITNRDLGAFQTSTSGGSVYVFGGE